MIILAHILLKLDVQLIIMIISHCFCFYFLLEQVVSDSVCSVSGEHGSTDVFKNKKRKIEK